MLKAAIKKAVNELMETTGKTEIECITALQGAAAQTGQDETLEILCEMKNELIMQCI